MDIKAAVLNPILYGRIVRRLGEVRVGHPGSARVAYLMRNTLSAEPKLVVRQHGEQYISACPFCEAPGRTLAINHCYAQIDPRGWPMTYLARCFAENCLSDRENRGRLAAMLRVDDGILEYVRNRPGRREPEAPASVELPGPLTRLDRLRRAHRARRALAALGLDPERVGRCYGVSYCGSSSTDSLARGRIIVPVTMGGKPRGWQSLGVGEPGQGSDLKLLNARGMRASACVYNLDRARRYETLVVVEGPLEVWRFGPMALCPLAGLASGEQAKAIARAAAGRPAILLMSDAALRRDGVARMARLLGGRCFGRFAEVRLPDARDGAILDRPRLRAIAAEGAARQGVRVRYGKAE